MNLKIRLDSCLLMSQNFRSFLHDSGQIPKPELREFGGFPKPVYQILDLTTRRFGRDEICQGMIDLSMSPTKIPPCYAQCCWTSYMN